MIWKQEVKKLIKHPLMWCLLGVFMVMNGFLLWGTLGDSVRELQTVHKEVLDNGIEEAFYKEKRNIYDSLDMTDVKEVKQEMFHYYPTGWYKRFIDERYEKLNERVEEIIESNEADGLVYPGELYRLHNKLYVKVLRIVFIELAIFVLFAVLFIMDYERMNRTIALTYTSNVGRKLLWTKWCVGMLVGLGFGGLILGGTLFIWFLMIPYQGFWDTSISAALMTEPRGLFLYPFITFQKMTVAQYLFATIAVGMLLVCIVGVLAGVVQIVIHNSYLSIICIMIFLMTGLYISGYSTESWLDIALSWNPADLWFRMGNWFMEGSLISNFKGAEMINVTVQIGFWSILGKLAYRKFMRKDC